MRSSPDTVFEAPLSKVSWEFDRGLLTRCGAFRELVIGVRRGELISKPLRLYP